MAYHLLKNAAVVHHPPTPPTVNDSILELSHLKSADWHQALPAPTPGAFRLFTQDIFDPVSDTHTKVTLVTHSFVSPHHYKLMHHLAMCQEQAHCWSNQTFMRASSKCLLLSPNSNDYCRTKTTPEFSYFPSFMSLVNERHPDGAHIGHYCGVCEQKAWVCYVNRCSLPCRFCVREKWSIEFGLYQICAVRKWQVFVLSLINQVSFITFRSRPTQLSKV